MKKLLAILALACMVLMGCNDSTSAHPYDEFDHTLSRLLYVYEDKTTAEGFAAVNIQVNLFTKDNLAHVKMLVSGQLIEGTYAYVEEYGEKLGDAYFITIEEGSTLVLIPDAPGASGPVAVFCFAATYSTKAYDLIMAETDADVQLMYNIVYGSK